MQDLHKIRKLQRIHGGFILRIVNVLAEEKIVDGTALHSLQSRTEFRFGDRGRPEEVPLSCALLPPPFRFLLLLLVRFAPGSAPFSARGRPQPHPHPSDLQRANPGAKPDVTRRDRPVNQFRSCCHSNRMIYAAIMKIGEPVTVGKLRENFSRQ